MGETGKLSYESLFARGAPKAGRSRSAPRRGRYDFAIAYPDPASVPVDGLIEALREALETEGQDLAVYPHPQGYPPLREFVAEKLAADRGIRVSPDEIILGDGSSQPIHMVVEVLVDPGDVVLTEDFVYSGTLATLRRFGADIRGVACDDDGMAPDALEEAIRTAVGQGRRPKLIYTIPTFQNPQGSVMSLERRRAVVELSQRYDVPILEDDCYVDLRFEGEPVPSIHSLDDTGRVMYVGSFSKIVAPGMRLGYLTGPPEVLDRAAAVKSGGGVNQFAALAVHRYATGALREHVDEINDIFRVKRDAMVAALGENLGSQAAWSRPSGGLFVWLRMPPDSDLVETLDKALAAGVGYQPGPMFAPDGESGRSYARLCFGYNTPEEIREGVAVLAEVFDREGLITA